MLNPNPLVNAEELDSCLKDVYGMRSNLLVLGIELGA